MPGLDVSVAGRIKMAPARNPAIATGRRELRLPVWRRRTSASHPPRKSPVVPASNGSMA